MITESFINLCCAVLLDDNNLKINDSAISEIAFILNSYNEEDIAIQYRKKLELTKTFLKLRQSGKKGEQITDDVIASGHFNELDSFIKGIEKRKIEENKIESALKQISERKQFSN